jgi:F-type H+-transporting ATPase subunit epsilon
MAGHLTLDILTPQGRVDLAAGDKPGSKGAIEPVTVEGVELPAALGEMGVLPGHIPFLTPLVPGVVRFRLNGQNVRLAVGAGFVEISETGVVTLLTERALRSGQIDVAAAREQRDEIAREIQKLPNAALTDPELLELLARRDWVEAQLRAAQV